MLSTIINKIIQNGNGSNTAWPFSFPIPDSSQLAVIYTDSGGAETVLSSSLYSVTGLGSLTGGSVTYPLSGSAIASGTKLTIYRTMPLTQTTQLSNQSAYLPQVTEARFDYIYMVLQQLQDAINRTVLMPRSESATPLPVIAAAAERANTALLFDSNGNPYSGTPVTGVSGASAFVIASVLPAANAGALRTNIAVPGLADNNTFTGINTLSAALNENQGVNIASATTTDIGAATGNYVKVTGTTTITGLGTIQAGTRRVVEFTGALTLTHNATSLILPGGANLVTAAGDCAEFISEGSGNWRCTRYMRAAAGGATTYLGADVSLSNTGTFFDGPNTGSLPPGDYLLTGKFVVTDTDAAQFTCQLHNGSTGIDSGSGTIQASGQSQTVTLTKFVTITAATTFKLQCKDITNTSGTLLRSNGTATTANQATSITWARLR